MFCDSVTYNASDRMICSSVIGGCVRTNQWWS